MKVHILLLNGQKFKPIWCSFLYKPMANLLTMCQPPRSADRHTVFDPNQCRINRDVIKDCLAGDVAVSQGVLDEDPLVTLYCASINQHNRSCTSCLSPSPSPPFSTLASPYPNSLANKIILYSLTMAVVRLASSHLCQVLDNAVFQTLVRLGVVRIL